MTQERRAVDGGYSKLREDRKPAEAREAKQVDSDGGGNDLMHRAQCFHDVRGRRTYEAAEADVIVAHRHVLLGSGRVALRIPALHCSDGRPRELRLSVLLQELGSILNCQFVASLLGGLGRSDDEMVERDAEVEVESCVVVEDLIRRVRRHLFVDVAEGTAVSHDRKVAWNPKEAMHAKAVDPLLLRLALFRDDLGDEDPVVVRLREHLVGVDLI